MTDEQLTADYETPSVLTNNQIAAVLTDESIEKYIKFSYNNGAKVWRGLLAEAAMRLYDDQGSCKHWHEFSKADDCLRLAMERRIWAHYEHAREKHPHFCDWLRPVHNDVPDPALMLDRLRRLIDKDGKSGMLCWETLVACENWEVIDAIVHGNYDSAVEECFDCIAVLLRVIDVLEGRQKLGKPEDAQCK